MHASFKALDEVPAYTADGFGIETLAGLGIGGSGGGSGGRRRCPQQPPCLHLAHDVAAGSLRGEGLGEESPEGHMQGEAPLAAVNACTPAAQKCVRDEKAEGFEEIREGVEGGYFTEFALKPRERGTTEEY